MARKKKHEEHENHERWLVSYADFITLLFAFFVVMYSISSVNEGKYRVLSDSLLAAFRAAPRSVQPIQVGKPLKSPMHQKNSLDRRVQVVKTFDLPMPRRQHGPEAGGGNGQTGRRSGQGKDRQSAQQQMAAGEAAVRRISDQVQKAMSELIKKHLIKVRTNKYWAQVEINTSVLFPSGSATLSPQARPILHKLADILRPFPNPIHVEGFTDNVPIHTVAFPSNWELSAARAASVVHLFTDARVRPDRLAAIGYGKYHPVAPNATAAGRRRNRRVVLVILASSDTDKGAVPQTVDAVGAKSGASVPGQAGTKHPERGPEASGNKASTPGSRS
ncbi:MAG TPA: flagellar motor protein MotD [Gammaproteobacteria bacterium]|nr:flagellar motor protein MotD [Gammaproteobacteria bacterium]